MTEDIMHDMFKEHFISVNKKGTSIFQAIERSDLPDLQQIKDAYEQRKEQLVRAGAERARVERAQAKLTQAERTRVEHTRAERAQAKHAQTERERLRHTRARIALSLGSERLTGMLNALSQREAAQEQRQSSGA